MLISVDHCDRRYVILRSHYPLFGSAPKSPFELHLGHGRLDRLAAQVGSKVNLGGSHCSESYPHFDLQASLAPLTLPGSCMHSLGQVRGYKPSCSSFTPGAIRGSARIRCMISQVPGK